MILTLTFFNSRDVIFHELDSPFQEFPEKTSRNSAFTTELVIPNVSPLLDDHFSIT